MKLTTRTRILVSLFWLSTSVWLIATSNTPIGVVLGSFFLLPSAALMFRNWPSWALSGLGVVGALVAAKIMGAKV